MVCLCLAVGCQAQTTIDSVLTALPKLAPEAQVTLINARFYAISSADFEQGKVLGERALTIARTHKLRLLEAKTLKNLGVNYYLLGKYELALGYYQQALDQFEALSDEAGKASVLNEMAIYYSRFQEKEKAVQYTLAAEQAALKARDSSLLATALDNRGIIAMQHNEWPQAQELFLRVFSIRQAIGDSIGLGYVLNNLASVASDAGNTRLAIDLIEQSTQIRAKMGDKQGMAVNYCNIGEAYLAANNYKEAKTYFEKSLAIASSINFLDLWQYDLEMLAKCEQQGGNFKEALHWLNLSNTLKDSLFNSNRSRQIAEMQTKYETTRKEKDLIREQLRVRSRNFWLLALFGLLLLSISVGYVIFKRQREKQAQLQREAQLQEELLRAEMYNGLQEERLRISRDLHDNLGAELTLIGSELTRQVQRTTDQTQQNALKNMALNARTAMQQLRETIWAIQTQDAPLQELLTKISEFSGKNTQIVVNITCKPALESLILSPGILLNLYRIAQEGITNAIKHAAADTVQILFDLHGPELRMVLYDDGRGFPINTQQAMGYGLQNIRQRAIEIGGDCNISSIPDTGTSITILVPLRAR
jgi:signal transduction histidine kinase